MTNTVLPEQSPTTGATIAPALTRADVKQLRKNIEKLKTIHSISEMKRVSHFDINALFKLGTKPNV